MTSRFAVRFWGVRGSIAASAVDLARVGANTSCVEVSAGEETLILDAGTGLFRLGQAWGTRRTHATLLFSHFHWDHIQGFPFFRPAYMPFNTFTLYGPGRNARDVEASLARQMQPPHFPVPLAAMRAHLDFRSLRAGDELTAGHLRVCAVALNHPQGCLGYRISVGRASLVYATDTEPLARGLPSPALAEFARDADLLIHDAQYTDDEYEGRCAFARKGWGHSTVSEACQLARAAAVKQLVLFHHDPSHNDRVIEQLEEQAHALFANSVAAREGMSVDLGLASAGRSPSRGNRCVVSATRERHARVLRRNRPAGATSRWKRSISTK